MCSPAKEAITHCGERSWLEYDLGMVVINMEKNGDSSGQNIDTRERRQFYLSEPEQKRQTCVPTCC